MAARPADTPTRRCPANGHERDIRHPTAHDQPLRPGDGSPAFRPRHLYRQPRTIRTMNSPLLSRAFYHLTDDYMPHESIQYVQNLYIRHKDQPPPRRATTNNTARQTSCTRPIEGGHATTNATIPRETHCHRLPSATIPSRHIDRFMSIEGVWSGTAQSLGCLRQPLYINEIMQPIHATRVCAEPHDCRVRVAPAPEHAVLSPPTTYQDRDRDLSRS